MYRISSRILVILGLSFFVFSTNADAQSIGKIEYDKELDARLLEIGLPEQLINQLDTSEKEDIANNDEYEEFVGGSTTYYDYAGNVIFEDDYTDSKPQFMPFGTIVNMTVTQGAYRLVSTSDREIFQLTSSYQWNISPVNRLTDVIGFSWDGKKFNLIPGTSWLVVGPNGNKSPVSHSSSNLFQSSFTGAGWSFPMPKTGTRPIAKARINIQETKAAKGNSQFHSLYSHTKGSGSVSLNLGLLSVSYTGGAKADQRATVTNFSY